MKEEYQELVKALAVLEQRYGLLQILMRPNILILIAMCTMLFILGGGLGKSKSKRTRAFLADKRTKYNLSREAIKQLKQKRVDLVCLYSGSFKNWQINPVVLWLYVYVLGRLPSLFVAMAGPGVEVIGAPGTGKTFSVIDPLVMSAIEQKYPVLLYDYKGSGYGGEGGQIPIIAGYAARHGYNLRIFAPGQDYTCTINPLDFIHDSNDRTMAETLAETLHENLRHNTGKSDNFFGPAGKRVLFSAFLLAKNTQYPDLAMAFAILQLPELGKRLKYAREQNNEVLTVWNYVAFSQYMTFAQAGETSEGILGGAQDIASVFIQPDLLPCVLGPTNVSLDLKGKQLLVFQSNELRKKVYNPLIAAIIEITCNRNFSYQRKDPLILSFDEYPTIKIKDSVNWPNWHRSKGLVMLVGYQNETQVADTYSKEALSNLRTGLKARFLFNPQNEDNENKWSKALGEKEVIIKNKSRSSGGSKSGKSTTISEQTVLTPIVRPDDIRGMRQGAAIYTNSQLYKGDRCNIPWIIKRIKVSRRDKRVKKRSKKIWFKTSLKTLRDREQRRRTNLDLDVELNKRLKLADEILPLPPGKNSTDSTLDTSDAFNFL